MIKKNIKWYILGIIIFLNVIIIPITFSKYATTLSKTLKLNIVANEKIAYFKEYDGNDAFFGFDKTNIESFSRNTDLTKEEVLEKENVQLISNTTNDDYKSKYEVYGWVEENNFYWWSEADIVYFHPKTMNAFRWMQALTIVDLTDISTSKVENFSKWFHGDESLTKIDGKINTEGLKKETGTNVAFSYMFNLCKLLETIDLSEFHTENATDMSSMFANCINLIKLDLGTFNTSNVTNFENMFESCSKLEILNLSNFDLSKATNCKKMFKWSSKLKTIILGDKFNKIDSVFIDEMFYYCTNLKAIYTKDFFKTISGNNVFSYDSKLIGGYDTEYETYFDENIVGSEYAKISTENQSGYFTDYVSIENILFTITYDLNGGTADNKTIYFKKMTFTLNNPEKEGYIFIGWTGSNGDIPEINVTISEENMGNKHYIAHYLKNNEINILGPCTFRGSSNNILGENCKIDTDDGLTLDYRNYKYIDTGIYLFSEENKSKDFEISFTIDSIDGYSNNDTIISSMNESGTPWPGFVYRINTSTSKLNLRAGYNGNTNWEMPYTSQNIKIVRENNILYYSVDGGDPIQTVNFSNFNGSFDYPLTIGAGLDETKNPRRYFKGTLSNISIKLK